MARTKDRTKDQRVAATQARELALTPVSNPYRGQYADPFADQRVPQGTLMHAPTGGQHIAASTNRSLAPPTVAPPLETRVDVTGRPIRPPAPRLAVAAGVLALVLGVIVGVLGLLLIALISISHNIDVGDRSFYQGQDSSYVLLGVLNLGVSAALVIGAVAMMTGRISGRIALTAGAWTVLGFSAFWGTQDAVPAFMPIVLAAAALAILTLSYQRSLTRWLGVLPPPQPE
jgi:hypothetical protein